MLLEMGLKLKRQKPWTVGAVMYQIYPRSFQDSNNDGIGDLKGITKRLDYLKHLGVNGVWLSPFYKSPMADFGYDVADYKDVDPIFGTLEDFKHLLHETHERDIKVIIDIVPNHTSDEHEWFIKSKSSRDNAYSDWYVWRDPIAIHDNQPKPPNNWRDMFSGGSSWQWVQERQQFYLHSFHAKQPDLNWENLKVRSAIHDVMRFWLDLGVDGFRVDAVPFLAKNPQLEDDSINPYYIEGKSLPTHAVMRDNSAYWPAHYSYVGEMSEILNEPKYAKKQRFLVCEGYPNSQESVSIYLRYFENMNPRVSGPFIFEPLHLAWRAEEWRDFLYKLNKELSLSVPNGLPSYAFGNHDQPRIVSRLDSKRARAAAVIEFTLPGIAYIYYGDEIGMRNVHIPDDMIKDPNAIGGVGRDPERTPMQWDASKHAGFSDAEITWLPLDQDYALNNVEAQLKDPASFLSLYRNLIRLRRSTAALLNGTIEFNLSAGNDILAYTRIHGRSKYTTIVNFAAHEVTYPIKHSGMMILSSQKITLPKHRIKKSLTLAGYEAVIIRH